MRKIVCRDSCELQHDAGRVFKAVSDVSAYEHWWPEDVKIKVICRNENISGSKVEIRSSGGRFKCELISFVDCKEVTVNYYGGVLRGSAVWLIEKKNGDSCRLHYNLDLVPHGFLPELLSNFIDFAAIHSGTMTVMFSGLKKYLDEGSKSEMKTACG